MNDRAEWEKLCLLVESELPPDRRQYILNLIRVQRQDAPRTPLRTVLANFSWLLLSGAAVFFSTLPADAPLQPRLIVSLMAGHLLALNVLMFHHLYLWQREIWLQRRINQTNP